MKPHLQSFLARLEGVRPTPSGFMACCPCADHGGDGNGDGNPSLSISLGDDDRILFHCFAGCPQDAILESVGLDYPALWPGGDPSGDNIQDYSSDHNVAKAGPTIPRATDLDVDLCDRVYNSLLARLTLTEAHRRQLRDRGLDDERIDRSGYRSLRFFEFRQVVVSALRGQFGDELLKVPGFVLKRGRISAVLLPDGVIIPARDMAGRVVALKVRRDEVGENGKYLWFSGGDGPSCASPVHVPRGVTPVPLVRVTEGPLKADVAVALSGLPTIAVPGVANWAPAVPLLKQWGTLTVRLAFDADVAVKKNLARQQLAFAETLIGEGIQVELERWPPEAGKGIDDYLLGGGSPEVVASDSALEVIRELAEGGRGEDGDQVEDGDRQVEEAESDAGEPGPGAPGDGQGSDPESEPAQASKPVAFPLDVLPEPVANFAGAMAESIGCPVDFIAHAQVTTAGAAIGDSRSLYISGTWFESARVYGCIIGHPGDAKSPALNVVVSPVFRLQKALDAEFEKAEQEYEAKLSEHELLVKALKGAPKARKADGEAVEGAAQAEGAPPEKPVRPTPVRIVTSDATVESLAPVLRQNPRGLLMHRDELSGWVRTMNMYRGGKGGDRQFYLSAWSGQDVVVDRKSEGTRSLFVPRPFMSVLGSIQPDMLSELADAKGRQDGFVDRLLFVYPDTAVGQPWPDRTVPRDVIRSWAGVLRRLYRLKMLEKPDGTKRPKVIKLTPEAAGILRGWWGRHLAEMRDPAFDRELLGGPFSKFRGHVARLALILHALRWVCHETQSPAVDAESARRAMRLADFYKAHCVKVHGRLRVAVEDRRADTIIDWIRRHGGRCNARDLCHGEVAGIRKASDARQMLKDLEDRGLGRCRVNYSGKKESVTFTAGEVVG